MKTVVLKEPRKIEIEEREMPSAGERELRIRVRAVAVGASEQRAFYGNNPSVRYPFVMGRSFAGEVVAMGTQVADFRLGDRVVVDPVLSCGHCGLCRSGHNNVCETLQVMGIHRDGGMAEYVSVPAGNAYAVPRDWSWERIAMVEPFSVVAQILSRTGCTGEDRGLVIGAGSMGLCVLLGAKHCGASVAVVDVLDSRLEAARELGADFVFNMNEEKFEQKVLDWTEGRGVSLCIDLVGLPDFFPALQRLAAPLGRIAPLGFSDNPIALIPLELTKKELTIFGSRLNRGKFSKTIEAFTTGHLQPERLVSHTFLFTEAGEAFKLIEESPVNTRRVLLRF